MKILLAIIITATFSFGCAMLEGEQTTTDSGGGGTTAAPTTPAPAIASWSGTKQLGASAYGPEGNGIASDSSGNVYMTGYTGSFGSFGYNIVVKYDSSGVTQWTQQIGTSSEDVANGIAIDSNGNVYVTGYTAGGLDGNTSAGQNDIFVVKYNSAGVKQWTQQLGTSSADVANGIAIDSNGNVYVTGYTAGALDGNSQIGNGDYFLVKYDSGGVKQWTQQHGTAPRSDYAWLWSKEDNGKALVTDSSGNIYVTGYTVGDLANAPYTGGVSYDKNLFVVKYDENGNKQ